jgi:hypothetical protein
VRVARVCGEQMLERDSAEKPRRVEPPGKETHAVDDGEIWRAGGVLVRFNCTCLWAGGRGAPRPRIRCELRTNPCAIIGQPLIEIHAFTNRCSSTDQFSHLHIVINVCHMHAA